MTSNNQQPPRPASLQSKRGWLLQLTGELLITLGVILFLFVSWQLWWTNIEARAQQDQAVADLSQSFNQQTEQQAAESPSYDPQQPPSLAAAEEGQAFGIIYIPRLGHDYARPIAEGVGAEVLDSLGLGHYPQSQQIGQYGNFALAGHRQTNGAVLDHIDQLQPGDPIYLQSSQGYYTYRVYQSQIVLPHQVEVIAPNPDNPQAPADQAQRRLLTLTSCHPRFGDQERYIVHAEFESWQPATAGPPSDLASLIG